MAREPYIAVVGPSAGTPAELALGGSTVGGVAEAGAVLVCGGMGGVMEAAAGGCAEAGGRSVGILPTEDRLEREPLPDGGRRDGHGRGPQLDRRSDRRRRDRGARLFGTLSEIALASRWASQSWDSGEGELAKGGEPVDAIVRVTDPREAVATALRLAGA